MKDVVACDKLRVAGKQALIRRFPNGETQCRKPTLRRFTLNSKIQIPIRHLVEQINYNDRNSNFEN